MTDAAATFDSPLGRLFVRVSNGRLAQLSFHNRPSTDVPDAKADARNLDVLSSVQIQIAEYFVRKRTKFDVPLDMRGPEFYRRVWAELLNIPYGQTVSYGALAAILGVPDSPRAVGRANGANPIAIIVPCHRVIGADGNLVGYGGGLRRKQMLLDLESAQTPLAFTT